MNHIQNLLRVAIIALLALFAFGPPTQSQAAPSPVEPHQFSCANVTEIPQIECEALVAIYNPDTNLPNGWLETTTPCSWNGIACENSHVRTLDLSWNQLNSLPTEIGNLTSLTTLDLDSNQLRSLPTEIGNLTSLTKLLLFSNQLSSLPTEIGNLTSLTELSLSSNQLSRVPVEIGNLTSLTWLNLYHNQLSSVPVEIGNLTSLTWLSLSSNQLNSVPVEIGNLTSLTRLYLSSNQLSRVPVEIGNLTSLTELSLFSNQLSSVPVEIGNLTSLTWISLGYNRLVISDNNLHAFVTKHDPDWATTQTITPTGLKATVLGEDSIELTWTAIAFQGKGGYYEISVADGGFFTVHGTTASKGDSRYLIDGLTSGTTYDIRIRTYTPAHAGNNTDPDEPRDDQNNELWSEYSPAVSTTTLIIKDYYEPDNDCINATIIQPDSLPQFHTFHTTGDTDWTTFTAPTAGIYRIEVTMPDDSRADIDLYYYTTCDGFHEESFTETFAPGARLDVEADRAGQQFYIRIKNFDPLQSGEDVTYNLEVRRMPSERDSGGELIIPGPAIVVAGRYRGADSAQDNIDQTALAAYDLFAAKGREDSEIFFLTTDSSLPNVDGDATERNLEYGITTWAKERLEQEGVAQVLTLYLVDHGGPDEFYLDRLNEEVLTPNDLDAWLTTLEADFPGLLVNVIIEACRAGSFIARKDGSISKPGRVIITSSSETYDAYVSRYGAHFSDNFLTFLLQERNLAYSFQESSNMVQNFHSKQEPWIDANGDGIPNEADDLSNASLRGFAEAGTLGDDWPPYIAKISQQHTAIQAEVRHQRGNADIKEVWAVVYPPSYTPPTGEAAYEDDGELNAETLDVIEFEADGEANYVEAESYTGFTEMGIYQVVVHARDVKGLMAQPVTLQVDTRYWVYLPAISR